MVQFEPEIIEYLQLKSESTQNAYSSAFKMFLEYYHDKHGEDKGLVHYLNRVFDEMKKPMREQRRVAELELNAFIEFEKKKEKSNNTIRLYVAAIQNLLKYKHITVSTRFIGNLPSATPQKINGKHEWKMEELKKFVKTAPTYRDKAIIMCMFQSGLAVNEICELNYSDIQDPFEKAVQPDFSKMFSSKTQSIVETVCNPLQRFNRIEIDVNELDEEQKGLVLRTLLETQETITEWIKAIQG